MDRARALRPSLTPTGAAQRRQTSSVLTRSLTPLGFPRLRCRYVAAGHRKHAEFCENGAKAVAEEATTHTVMPSFFAAHPVSEPLERRTTGWVSRAG